jgi:hypothetical protein
VLSSKDDILRKYKKETSDVAKSGDKREIPDVVKSAAELKYAVLLRNKRTAITANILLKMNQVLSHRTTIVI